MKNLCILLLVLSVNFGFAQNAMYTEKELKVSRLIEGTLLVPTTTTKPKLVILIASSGPTNRDGNSAMTKNNSLKELAKALSVKEVATFRYDKRSVKMIKTRDPGIDKVIFDDFVKDAKDVVNYFKKSGEFSEIYIAGHSQGSLIGMMAAQKDVAGFISIAGAGQPIDAVIVDQIAKQQPGLDKNAEQAFAELRKTGSTSSFQPILKSILSKDIQPFMLSWMQYNPAEEIKKLDMPVLIINGDKDIQVTIAEAELLHAARPDATYEIIPTMNHIFRAIDGDDLENQKSYNAPTLPIVPALSQVILTFINN